MGNNWLCRYIETCHKIISEDCGSQLKAVPKERKCQSNSFMYCQGSVRDAKNTFPLNLILMKPQMLLSMIV